MCQWFTEGVPLLGYCWMFTCPSVSEYFTVWFMWDYCSIFNLSLNRCGLCLSCDCQPKIAGFLDGPLTSNHHHPIAVCSIVHAWAFQGRQQQTVGIMLLGFLGIQLLNVLERRWDHPYHLSCSRRKTVTWWSYGNPGHPSSHLVRSHVLCDLCPMLTLLSRCHQ